VLRGIAKTVIGSAATMPVSLLVTLASIVPLVITADEGALARMTEAELKLAFTLKLTTVALCSYSILHVPLVPWAIAAPTRESRWMRAFFWTMGGVSAASLLVTAAGWTWLLLLR
jgi:hypothetical protein